VTSKRRRLRAGRDADDGDGVVPAWARRFRRDEWPDHATTFDAHKAWRAARMEWAAAHGFDPHAKYGQSPGRDWWAFLELCKSYESGPGPKG
jgi:hypothetical protein